MKMFKCSAKTKVEFFDDAGEIQIVPIDTVVDDGSINPGADMDSSDGSRRNQPQGFGARGESRRSCAHSAH
jgi:hypothetical protein